MEDETLDIPAAAKFLGVRPSTIRAWCSRKRLPYFKAGRCVRFRRSWLEEFIALWNRRQRRTTRDQANDRTHGDLPPSRLPT
jgi:excisionase family DNA binding protein